MQAELNQEMSQESINELLKAQQNSKNFWLKEMVENKVEYNPDKMFEALREKSVQSVNVSLIKPGDIISRDGKKMKVLRINSETGEPIYEEIHPFIGEEGM